MDYSFTRTMKVMPNMVSSEVSETYKISPEQFKFYIDNGYLVIKQLIDFTSLYSYKQRFAQICKGVVPKGGITVVKEPALLAKGAKGEDLINKFQDILYDDVFGQYFEDPRLLNIVTQFIGAQGPRITGFPQDEPFGDNITAMHSMLINKPPGTSRHPPHQDLYYFPFRPADKIIATWTAIDDVTLQNGALYVIPGSHLPGVLYKHGNLKDSNKLYHGILDEEKVAPQDKRVHLEMSPGDTVFFHPNLVHGSGPNVSKAYRKSISCHFANSSCHYISTEGTVQEGVAKEVEAESQRRGMPVSFQDAWHLRSKQIKGVRCNL